MKICLPILYQKAGEVSIAEEMEANQNKEYQRDPQQNIHAVGLHILFIVTIRSAKMKTNYKRCNFLFKRSIVGFY